MNRKTVTVKDYTKEYFKLQLRASREFKGWAETRIRDVLSFAEPSERDVIADVGCGVGTFVIECEKRGSRVYGVDFSRAGLAIAKKLSEKAGVSEKVFFINSVTEAMAVRKDSVNKVICTDLVEHLYPRQFDALLKELHRITKNTGCVIIYTPSPSVITKLPKLVKELGKLILGIHKQGQSRWSIGEEGYEYLHVDYKSSRFLRKELKNKGFFIEKEVHTRTALPFLEKLPVIQDFLGGHKLIKARLIKQVRGQG